MKSVQLLMDSYFTPNSKTVHFDYTHIRAKGAPIKGFGGISSGYVSLEKLHNEIRSFIECYFETKKIGIIQATINMCRHRQEEYVIPEIEKIGRCYKTLKDLIFRRRGFEEKEFEDLGLTAATEILEMTEDQLHKKLQEYTKTYGPARLVTDLCNAVGVCIISANVRRSAEIALGRADDIEFLNLKNFKLNPERASIGWMSNNTVVLSKTEDFDFLPQIGERIKDNGEPGILNQINVKRYGRVGNYSNIGREAEEDKAIGINPCITGDTLISTTQGQMPVRNLVNTQFTACIEDKDFKSTSVGFWCSGNKDVFRVTLENGNSVKATSNHRFLMDIDDKPCWREVGKMKVGQSIICHKSSSPITCIEPAGNEKVYDCTIPGVNAFIANGMYSHNCGEIPLESQEMCCLGDLFSNRCANYEELAEAAELITIYASTISLYSTHWSGTNAVINRNHRIGISFCGIADYHDKYGPTMLNKNLRSLYKIVKSKF